MVIIALLEHPGDDLLYPPPFQSQTWFLPLIPPQRGARAFLVHLSTRVAHLHLRGLPPCTWVPALPCQAVPLAGALAWESGAWTRSWPHH